MNGRTSSTILRGLLPRRSSAPQHTSSPFRLSPSSNSSSSNSAFVLNSSIISPSSQTTTAAVSRRTLSSTLRSQTNHATLRAALACECSSLRYALLLKGEGEEALLRGWDAGVVEDEDGT
ncbi:hypothetical protein ACHAXR_005552 [Thalassiosira sp. AJA248-18]